MNEQQQIKEMAEVLRHSCEGECFKNADGFIDCEACEARLLYDAGYRKQHRGTWIDLGDQRCQCSECGSVRYGNSKACIIEYHLAPFCEKCGALLCDLTSE